MTPAHERREATRSEDDELDLQHSVSRQESRKVASRRALQRLIGSSVLGAIAAWKVLTYEVGHDVGEPHRTHWLLVVWIGLALLSFGLASWDQLAKVIRR